MSLTTPPLALYVHFPWCVRKCPYCDFNSYALKEPLPEEAYLGALLRDLEHQASGLCGRPLASIFFGGGTPSLFSPRAIARLLESVRGLFESAPDLEITLEANPGTIERGRFAEYRAAGVNRVSLGAQSFDARRLEILGRIHAPADTARAAEELHAAGLDNFNLDLMYGLPEQDVAGALADLEQALALVPAHLSHYQLTVEPGTVFAAHPPRLPGEELAFEMLAVCQARLAAAGFERYETSAYAPAGRQCRHNRNYWLFGDYLGVGAGAHGKLTRSAAGTIERTAQWRDPRRYLAAPVPVMTASPIAARDLPFEFMLNALRLTQGFAPALFGERTGLDWETVAPRLHELEGRGLLERTGGHWRTSELGGRFLNEVLLSFVPEPVSTQVSRLSTRLDGAISQDARGTVIHSGSGLSVNE